MNRKGLIDAASALEDLAAGNVPAAAQVAAGAAALEKIHADYPGWRDVSDALFGLKALASGCGMDLDANGRQRAGRLAGVVRSLIDQISTVRLQHRLDRQDRQEPDAEPAPPAGVGLGIVAHHLVAAPLQPVQLALLVELDLVGGLRHHRGKGRRVPYDCRIAEALVSNFERREL